MRQYIEVKGLESGENRCTTYIQQLNDDYNIIAAVNEYCIFVGYERVSVKLIDYNGNSEIYCTIEPPKKLLNYGAKIRKKGVK